MPKTKLLYLVDAYLKTSPAKITKTEKIGNQFNAGLSINKNDNEPSIITTGNVIKIDM